MPWLYADMSHLCCRGVDESGKHTWNLAPKLLECSRIYWHTGIGLEM